MYMTKCRICDKRNGTVKVEEPRYFVGEGLICGDCFQNWGAGNYKELDDRAIDKIFIKEQSEGKD